MGCKRGRESQTTKEAPSQGDQILFKTQNRCLEEESQAFEGKGKKVTGDASARSNLTWGLHSMGHFVVTIPQI